MNEFYIVQTKIRNSEQSEHHMSFECDAIREWTWKSKIQIFRILIGRQQCQQNWERLTKNSYLKNEYN